MRIEVDKGLEKLLGQVKEKELGICGRGHVETVRFLANYYLQHKPLEVLREEIRNNSKRKPYFEEEPTENQETTEPHGKHSIRRT